MATQGLVSVIKDGRVILKAVAGIDGYYAKKLADRIRTENLSDIESVYDAAMEIGFGGEPSLVVIDSDHAKYEGEIWNDDEIKASFPLYRQTFNDPKFNPRWEYGIVDEDCLAIVEL